MKKEDFGPVVAPEVIKDMDWEEALEWMIKPHNRNLLEEKPYVIYAGADTIGEYKRFMEGKFFDMLMTGQCSVSDDEIKTIATPQQLEYLDIPPKKKEKPHPEFGG